ncbi:MAG: tetratricopeptide repeat protein [Flavobacteriaceae bacterium]|nr:tetratricopeptide repeat protein [Flavobacteriaceae bacterium]
MNWRINVRVIGLLLLSFSAVVGQDQRTADSLAIIYSEGNLQGEGLMDVLRDLSYNELRDPDKALEYSEELIRLATKANDYHNLFRGFRQKAEIHLQLGNFDSALEAYFKSLDATKMAQNINWQGSVMTGIADTYSEMGNSSNASEYYNEAINVLRTGTDTIALAISMLNAGDEYFKARKYDSALVYFKESAAIFEQQDYLIGKAYAMGNTGMVQAATGDFEQAKSNINEAVAILEELEDSYAISEYLTYMADAYKEQGDTDTAMEYAQRSLQLARQFGIKQQISESNLKVSQIYEAKRQPDLALSHFKEHVDFRDSVNNLRAVQNMADLRTDYEVSQKQVEVDLLNQQKRNQQIILASVGVLAAVLLWFFISIRKEKRKSDELLLNILPEEIAKELKEKGEVSSVRFENVSVLFTDFVQFSKIAEESDPERLVKSLDRYFKKFDEITAKYGLEKIKTIGDAYMCACGLPSADPDHGLNTVRAAKEMAIVVSESLKSKNGLARFDMRIGIHSGSVIAGIVGTKKFQYDIWGDAVNIASRMESNSEPGKINISETTYEEIKEEFECSYRGEIDVKNRGALKMYFVN